MNKEQQRGSLWIVFGTLGLIATIITLAGIWTQDERWANTAFLFWTLTAVPAVILIVRWLEG